LETLAICASKGVDNFSIPTNFALFVLLADWIKADILVLLDSLFELSKLESE
jgi:hypothetical protein